MWRELSTSRALRTPAALTLLLVAWVFSRAIGGYSGTDALRNVIAPTFRAYTIALALFYPFPAIELVFANKPAHARMAMGQFVALMTTWIILLAPGVVALIVWGASAAQLQLPWPRVAL